MASNSLISLRELIRLYGLSAKQELSQNFILDLNITGTVTYLFIYYFWINKKKIIKEKLIKSCGSFQHSVVLEVGPGPGALTRSILKENPLGVIVVEKDKRFLPGLEVSKNPFLETFFETKTKSSSFFLMHTQANFKSFMEIF